MQTNRCNMIQKNFLYFGQKQFSGHFVKIGGESEFENHVINFGNNVILLPKLFRPTVRKIVRVIEKNF